MSHIVRDPAAAARTDYDLIIIGGGIYGVALALESTRRGLRPLLLEKGDFGGATTFNSLRILHGGLRYLQSLDLSRFRESVGERSWFLRTFPDLVHPMPCLMPLYGKGAKRPPVFRAALLANDFLSRRRNDDVRGDRRIPGGHVVGPERVKELFPHVDVAGLKGGAVWYDVTMPDSQRIVMEMLRWACFAGATALNYVEVGRLRLSESEVQGVTAVDHETGDEWTYNAPIVINATGPWCRGLAAKFDRDVPALFRSSLAWNVLFERPALSSHAVAVAPKKPGSRTYFIVPWKGKMFAGTGHAPGPVDPENPLPSEDQLAEFIADLNLAMPSLNLRREEIVRLTPGLLPAVEEGGVQLANSEVIYDHGQNGGPRGFFSVSGVKFTTARLVVGKLLDIVLPGHSGAHQHRQLSIEGSPEKLGRWKHLSSHQSNDWPEHVRSCAREESVVHLDDLVLRRTTLWDDPRFMRSLALPVCEALGWSASRTEEELDRLRLTTGES